LETGIGKYCPIREELAITTKGQLYTGIPKCWDSLKGTKPENSKKTSPRGSFFYNYLTLLLSEGVLLRRLAINPPTLP
jgi:hypothetical protein